MTVEPIMREMNIAVSPERAFNVFTQKMGCWVPIEHSLLGAPTRSVVIEPKVGGAWYEVTSDGKRQMWGKVAVWKPPTHLRLIWQLDHKFEYDPTIETFIDVWFEPANGGTKLRFVHSGLDSYGNHACDMKVRFERPGAWTHWLDGLDEYLH